MVAQAIWWWWWWWCVEALVCSNVDVPRGKWWKRAAVGEMERMQSDVEREREGARLSNDRWLCMTTCVDPSLCLSTPAPHPSHHFLAAQDYTSVPLPHFRLYVGTANPPEPQPCYAC